MKHDRTLKVSGNTNRRAALASLGAVALTGCGTVVNLPAPSPSPTPQPIRRQGIEAAPTSVSMAANLPSPAATSADGALQRIALLSCIDQKRPTGMLETVRADRPGLVLFAGDNVYANHVPFALSHLDEAYRTLGTDANFQRLRDAAPHMAIWDDNDYGLNDGGASFSAKHDSKSYFLNFWKAAANDPRRARDGLYYASIFGPVGKRVQVIMLDGRFNRSPWTRTDQRDAPGKERYVPTTDTGTTMLGEAQWRWFEEQLRTPAEVRLVVSGIQVLAEGHGWERWGLFPHERARMFDLITRTQSKGVVLLSGDRHIGAFYRDTFNAPYPLTEMTSSGVTHVWDTANEAGPNRVGDLVRELHFGVVEIDWATRVLALKLKNARGATVRELGLSIDSLQPMPRGLPIK